MNEVRNEPSLTRAPGADPELEALERSEADASLEGEPDLRASDVYALARQRRRGMRRQRRMRRLRLALGLIALCGIAALLSIVWQPETTLPLSPATQSAPAAPGATEPARARYPIEPVAASLPTLDASDDALINALRSLWSSSGIVPFLEPRNLIRNIVVTVDNLPRRALPAQHLPMKALPGSFGTASAGNALVISERNALRYLPVLKLMEAVDAKQLVDAYVRFYPLFQQAYRDLGYPDGHFNDRLVEAIDSLLATPDHKGQLAVVQPKIFYEFADRELEQLPAGQKLLLRMGRENAALMKAKLREVRRLIANEELDVVQAPPQPLLR